MKSLQINLFHVLFMLCNYTIYFMYVYVTVQWTCKEENCDHVYMRDTIACIYVGGLCALFFTN